MALEANLYEGGVIDPVAQFGGLNGVQFLYVSGSCEFWVNSGSWFTGHGVFDSTTAAEVAELLQLEGLEGGSWPAPDDCYDAPALRIRSGGVNAECECGCPSAPPEVRAADQAFARVVERIASQAETWMGPMRVFVRKSSTSLADRNPQPWPLQAELGDFIVTDSDIADSDASGEPLRGRVLDDEAEIAALHALRQRVAALKPEHTWPTDRIAIEDAGQFYSLYAVDLMPPLR